MVMLTNMTKQIQNKYYCRLIQVTKSNFPTTATSKKVSPNDCDNDRQPEIAILPPNISHKCADVHKTCDYFTVLRKCMGHVSSSEIYNISTDTNISGEGGMQQ